MENLKLQERQNKTDITTHQKADIYHTVFC